MQFVDAFLLEIKNLATYLNHHTYDRYLLITSILVLLVFLFWSSRSQRTDQSVDISAIAGDDVIATQLDLAKAYIEMNNIKLAKEILKKTLKKGNKNQKMEARYLLKAL
jgi:FimV-like protein